MKRHTTYEIPGTSHGRAFTLVELLLALSVAGIVLAAVTTLAFALSSAANSSDDTAHKQAQVRYATLRVTELIRTCKLICGTPNSDLAVWRADNNNDGQININELVYIQKGSGSNLLRLCFFPSSDTSLVSLAAIGSLTPDGFAVTYVSLIPRCSNVQFYLHPDRQDDPAPRVRRISISFDLAEDNVVHHYQIDAALRCWAGNLLNPTATALVERDDD